MFIQAKDAFDSVCAKVAAIYEKDGWKYSKSQHWMTNLSIKCSFTLAGIMYRGKMLHFMESLQCLLQNEKINSSI